MASQGYRRVTLKEVATAAGVSLATASKALNGRADVSRETRDRVERAARGLNFTPNAVAKQLAAGRSFSVGLITSDLDGRFSIPILMGAENAFGSNRMSVLLCDAREDSIRERVHLESLLARNVDGLIVVGSRTDPRPSLGPDIPVPVVYAYAPSDAPGDCSIVCDNVGAGELVARHLLSLEHRKIAMILGDSSYAATHDRLTGVTQVLAAEGLDLVGPKDLFGSWSEQWGRAATAELLELHPDIDAIICASDQIARGSLDELRALGRRVPEDVAVASFDNWEILATGSNPQLTSVDMNFEALGRAAALQILAALEGAAECGISTQPCRLVVRGSTVRQGA